jgi:predicted HTH domain antitoxin
MKTKSIRITEDMLSAVELVKKEEKIEEATAMRKLMKIGFEAYLGNLYRLGKITLREAAQLLNMNQSETMDMFLDMGIKGNLDAADVLYSLNRFTGKPHRNNPSAGNQ